MKVKDMIKELKKFDGNLEVIISDGFNYNFYIPGDYEISEYEDLDGKNFVDIGVGGFLEK